MAPKTKKKMSNAERQRLYRERRRMLNPDKVEENKKKDRERYHAKKKLVNDLTEREKRHRRKNTRKRVQRFREKQKKMSTIKLAEPTTANTPQKTKLGRKQIRRDRSKLYRENLKLKELLQSAKKQANMHRKRAERMRKNIAEKLFKTPDSQLTPKSLTRKTLDECFRDKGKVKEKVARKLFLHNAMAAAIKENYMMKSKTKEKHNFKHAVSNALSKYRILTPCLAKYLGLKNGFRKTLYLKKKESIQRKKAVEAFFGRDDNSRATSGKKEVKTQKKEKRQKRFLISSIKTLHKKYVAEGNKISYESFRKNRPFHIINPTLSDQKSSLCELHTNLEMKIKKLCSLKICSSSDINELISYITCNADNKICMYRQCIHCKEMEVPLEKQVLKDITWFEWVKISEEIKDKHLGKIRKVNKVKKVLKHGSSEELSKKFQFEMKKICKHIYNIKKQYLAYKLCRDNMKNNEALIHIDFSENYSCKMGEEIQSFHFGGSRSQVTLHTGVLYTSNQSSPVSFCTIAADKRHDPAAIWAHLDPIFKMLKKIAPSVTVIHFFSDGPTTQYRQKQNFYFLNHQLYYYGFKHATWNFFEAGHGKGAADGVGAALKRKADRLIAFGEDIADAHQFFEAVRKDTKIKVFWVDEQDIDFLYQTLPQNIIPLKGTMKIHQLVTTNKSGLLKYRDVSCFCDEHRGLCPCFEWKEFEIQKLENDQTVSEIADAAPLKSISVSEKDINEVRIDNITKGIYLLVELETKRRQIKYSYAAVTQNDLEEDGEVPVMFLKSYDETAKIFRVDETDVAHVQFEQIKKILPMPEIIQKGDRIFYKFPFPIDIFEK